MMPYTFHGQVVLFNPDASGPRRFEARCSVPAVIEAGIMFMHEHGVARLAIDGVEIQRGSWQ